MNRRDLLQTLGRGAAGWTLGRQVMGMAQARGATQEDTTREPGGAAAPSAPWGDDEVGALPDDFALFHYPNISIVGEEVFVSYYANGYRIGDGGKGNRVVQGTGGGRTRILPVDWFYA